MRAIRNLIIILFQGQGDQIKERDFQFSQATKTVPEQTSYPWSIEMCTSQCWFCERKIANNCEFSLPDLDMFIRDSWKTLDISVNRSRGHLCQPWKQQSAQNSVIHAVASLGTMNSSSRSRKSWFTIHTRTFRAEQCHSHGECWWPKGTTVSVTRANCNCWTNCFIRTAGCPSIWMVCD